MATTSNGGDNIGNDDTIYRNIGISEYPFMLWVIHVQLLHIVRLHNKQRGTCFSHPLSSWYVWNHTIKLSSLFIGNLQIGTENRNEENEKKIACQPANSIQCL